MSEPKYQEWSLELLHNRLTGKVENYDEEPTDEELDMLSDKFEREFRGEF